MSIWALVSLLLLLFWWLHVQRLNGIHEQLSKELQEIKKAHGDLESTLVSRGRRLDVLFSAVNEVVMRVDRLGRVMAANTHASTLFEMNRAQNLPQSMLLFYRDPEWNRAFSAALKALPDSAALPDMHIGQRVLAPRLAPLGREQALLLCMDVTEKHRVEAQRKSLFANLMHDLKTPLTSILGYARSIETFGDDVEVRNEAVNVIASESIRANEFLDALLTLEHIESIKPDTAAVCDVNEVTSNVLHGFQSQLDEKQISIERVGDETSLRVRMSEGDIHRILDNLIENALRYTPEKSTIFIHTDTEQGMCRVEVIDQGDGVSEKELPRLTERFYRADQARSKQDDVGHGLGLAIVKELLEKYGGRLEISNHDRYGLRVVLQIAVV